MAKFPHKIKQGDCIGLVACSSAISNERLDSCINVIKGLGYQVKVADNITSSKGGYMAGDEETEAAFKNALNADCEYSYIEPYGKPIEIMQDGCGEVSGQLVGGNLELICTSIGTPYEIDTDGKILFIEEIRGHIGNTGRKLYQLRDCGKLDKVAGIIIGQFTDFRIDMPGEYEIENVVMEALLSSNRVDAKSVPVMSNIQSGHGKPMITLPIGATCRIDTKNKTIKFDVER